MNDTNQDSLLAKSEENKFDDLNQIYRECLEYLQNLRQAKNESEQHNGENNKNNIEEHVNNIEEHLNDIEEPENNIEEHKNEIQEHVDDTCDISDESEYDDVIDETSKLKTKTNITENIKLIKRSKSEKGVSKESQQIETAKSIVSEYKYSNEDMPKINYDVVNELNSNESVNSLPEPRSQRLRKLSQQLPKIIITNSDSGIDTKDLLKHDGRSKLGYMGVKKSVQQKTINNRSPPPSRNKAAYGVFPKRLVSKSGLENVALITNVPFEKIRLLNDTFHTLINLRWRWIVSGTVVVHFGIWLVFAVWWYVAALAHYDLEPDPPRRACVTGGKDFVTIFLASVEAQTTIGFGDRAIDEECPEAIFLFIMQLILGTGLSGVLTCVVYAKLTRPEKLSRDGVGFSKKAVISLRDGQLCLMIRAWDLNYDHIISSEFSAHFITTHRTKEGETLRYYTRTLRLQQRQFPLWPVTLVHVIDEDSPMFRCSPDLLHSGCYEITVSLKGASASMGTFTQSQTSYMPHELIWGHRFPPVVKYDKRKQKYVIEHRKLDVIEPVDTPYCSACQLHRSREPPLPGVSPSSSFGERITSFVLKRSSSFKRSQGKVS